MLQDKTLAKPFNQNTDIVRTIKRVCLSHETLKKTLRRSAKKKQLSPRFAAANYRSARRGPIDP